MATGHVVESRALNSEEGARLLGMTYRRATFHKVFKKANGTVVMRDSDLVPVVNSS